MAGNLTTEALVRAAAHQLRAGSETPQLDAELLLAHTLGVTRARLRSHADEVVSTEAASSFHTLIARRALGEPVAYLTGYKEFWSLRLKVNPAVLVPRPETELLVERALALLPERRVRCADLGTGSGAIALALAIERPDWHICATDASATALAVACENAIALGLERVEFILGDWFEPLRGRRFELLTSNPPYIGKSDAALSQTVLRYEPAFALTPGTDALAALRSIVRAAPDHLERGGWLLLEHGAEQGTALANELVARGFSHVRSHRDVAGHERATEARWA
jgi:release factor glutamine methyltransferase